MTVRLWQCPGGEELVLSGQIWLRMGIGEVVDSAGDGNRDHADSEPLGFRTRSVLGFGASWAFAGDGEPLEFIVASVLWVADFRSIG
ncbi:hypothetical protein TIFTF001_028865 [Ficus carica]|uniref:Uncharacterized protein n=1 Tax=Ficus carica TaxID=3494 RepID=A0AA88DQQ9_FICCA|nr:hypothetical protein TIFTF001_028865 [Ficus carica]